MTLSVTAPSQSPGDNKPGPFPPAPSSTPSPPTERGYSDSIVPSCVMSADKQQFGLVSQTSAGPVSPQALGDLHRSAPDRVDSLPSRKKAKHDLRLPPFSVQDIAIPKVQPIALLTPPDEFTLSQSKPLDKDIQLLPEGQPLPFTDMSSSVEASNMTAQPTLIPQPDPAQQQSITVTTPMGHVTMPEDQSMTPTERDTSPEEEGGATPFTEVIKTVTSAAVSNPSRSVVSVLCHSQPCPLANEGTPTTAFNELLGSLQLQIPMGAYIDITHAVPVRFSMGQVPHSPFSTPHILQSNEPADYFGIQNTFSKAVIATSYQEALESSVPSSPHPVVVPSTVHVSLLERYIPPTSSYEFKDLFATDAPSALVNRLTELSSDNGTVLFVYPTKTGARTFEHDYLGPLLHPLLRNLTVSLGLASDLGTSVANLVAIESLLSFDDLKRKLELLLRKLSRKSSSLSASTSSKSSGMFRPSLPCFQLKHASVRDVQLDRESWQKWYLHQERSRIQDIVGKYFKRGYRLPSLESATAGQICRNIMEGLERQEYPDRCPPSVGVEVGVFVVQRVD